MASDSRSPRVEIRRRRRADGSVSEVPTVRWTDASGARRRRSCATVEEAELERARLAVELGSAGRIAAPARPMTVAEFWPTYRADIAGLFVLPRYRRRGIATALLVHAAKWLQEDGISRVTAACHAHDPSRTFFERRGGVVIASATDDTDPTAVITYGFANLRELAARS